MIRYQRFLFLLLLLLTLITCSEEPVSETSIYEEVTVIEDHERMIDVLTKAQATERFINNLSLNTRITQNMDNDDTTQKIIISTESMLNQLYSSGHIKVNMELLEQVLDFEMYMSEEATYVSNVIESHNEESSNKGITSENKFWQKLTGTDHEEIMADLEKNFLIINYDTVLKHVDDLYMSEVSNHEWDIHYYSFILNGNADLYKDLITSMSWIEDDNENDPSSIDSFSIHFKIDKHTLYPLEVRSSMSGITEMQGEPFKLQESIFTEIGHVNRFSENDFRIPTEVIQSAERTE